MASNGLMLNVVLVCAVVLCEVYLTQAGGYCTEEEQTKSPCHCCKMRCWYDITKIAQETLGYMPGKGGAGESMEVLKAIKQCAKTNCQNVCPLKKPLLA